MTWTKESGKDYVATISPVFTRWGLSLEIIGSVAKVGQSDKDLDLLVHKQDGDHWTIEKVLTIFENEIINHILCKPCLLNPVESPRGDWFVNLGLHDGRVVEFYFPQEEFVFE